MVEKHNNLKPKTYFPFIYLLFFAGLFSINLEKRDFSWGGLQFNDLSQGKECSFAESHTVNQNRQNHPASAKRDHV